MFNDTNLSLDLKVFLHFSDADRNVSPKDLVSTIIQAANKKIKRKDKKSVGSDDIDTVDCTFGERNIDREVARRKLQQVQDSSLNDSQTQSESSSISTEHKASQDNLDSAVESRKKFAPFATFDEEFPEWEVIHTTTEVTRSGHLPHRPPLSRHYSDESLLEKSDELEISHGLNSSYSLSRDTLDRLRRIELEARALREREELRQREHEKRRIEKQRIELELQRAQRDLDHENSHSVEDLLNPQNVSLRISEYADKSPDLRSGSTSSASDSVFSLERNAHSGNRNSGGYVAAEQMPAGPISIRLETRSYGHRGETMPKMETTTSTRGGQYFLHSVNPRPGDRRTGSRPHGQYGIESLTTKGKLTGSLETIVDNKQSGGGSRSQPKKREIPQSSVAEQKPITGPFMRNGSVRKGSLDSLIDFYDKQENRMSWASTDSEDGSDLLTSLTTTFDQKLQILLNPKYKLTGSSRRQNKTDASSDSSSTHSEAVEKPQIMGAAAIPLTTIVHKKGPESSLSFSNPNLVSDSIKEKPFRDPSLHRSQKSEAKIGIASRFERNPIKSASALVSASESTSGATVNTISTARVRPSMVTFTIGLDKPVQSVEPNTSGVVTTVASVQDSSEHPALLQSKVKIDIRPISKSEKTEVNISLSKLDKDLRSFESKVCNVEHGKTVKSGNTKRNADTAKDSSGAKSRSASPPPTKRKHVDKCDKRRHTVGGTDDLEHFKALVSITQQKDDVQISAWDQLQPAVKDRDGSESRSMFSWLQKERLRTSSPDLSQQTTKEKATKKA